MDIVEETEKALATLDPKEREERISDLDWPFEEGRLFAVGGFKKEDVGKAASLILFASLEEKDEQVKDEMFSVLGTAVSWNDISNLLDWDRVVEQLPYLSLNGLVYALDLVGYSRRISDVDVLRRYLDHDQVSVQTFALSAIRQIWWDVSGHDPQVKALMYIEESKDTEFQPVNPTKHDLPASVIKEQFQSTEDKVMRNLEEWLEQQR
jgi:hypothetical protein